jgi:hypothetical protein
MSGIGSLIVNEATDWSNQMSDRESKCRREAAGRSSQGIRNTVYKSANRQLTGSEARVVSYLADEHGDS